METIPVHFQRLFRGTNRIPDDNNDIPDKNKRTLGDTKHIPCAANRIQCDTKCIPDANNRVPDGTKRILAFINRSP